MADASVRRRNHRFKHIAGQRYGRLVALEPAGADKHGNALWLCRCDCGGEKVAVGFQVRQGAISSCGCRVSAKSHGCARKLLLTPEYRAWRAMKARCRPQRRSAHRYYERGITVCELWERDFDAFLEHMGPKPTPAHTLERLDNDRGYEPGNCAWATQSEQMNNTGVNRRLEHGGLSLTVTQWARRVGLTPKNLDCRLRRGWGVERALTQAARA